MEKKEQINFFELEYTKMDKAEILTHLNKLLSSYHIFHHKVKNFHWNVVGRDSINLRELFKTSMGNSYRHMDELSERIRTFNQVPVGKLYEIIKTSEIKEDDPGLSGFEMVKSVLSDILILLKLQSESIDKAQEVGDYGTDSLLKNLTKDLERDYTVFVSWLK
ncbi:MAG: DNA starvation/stationary phase protection protein [Bacteroidota bacterium]|nr:DNA starvation/stationary phase protection protein [Bacteroidota bacterium]